MVRTALAQIFYKPAIIEKQVDHLAEPGLLLHGPSTASLLEALSQEKCLQLQTLHNQIREQYITYIGKKLEGICKEAHRIHPPDILVFPEYSIPYQCLPQMKELSEQFHMTIVAGTHTVIPAAQEYYAQAGLDSQIAKSYNGCSISPVFFPDKKPDFQVKNDRSIFEITMRESEDGFKRFEAVARSGEPYSFSVVICADALTLGTAGKADVGLSDTEYDNFMVITVACSTNPDAFEGTAKLFALQGIPMLICNASQYGGSGIFLPEAVRERFTNIPGQPSSVQAHNEMLMLLDFLPSQFSVKKGVLDKSVRGSWAMCPICYGRNQIWRSDYLQTLHEMENCLQADDIIGAADYAEILRSLHEGQLPPALEAAFNSFIAHTANFCGDTQACILQLKALLLDIHSTQAHLYSELSEMGTFCFNMGSMALPQLNSLVKQRDKYPEEPLIPIQPTLPASITRASPTESENIEFRDRGNYMNQLQDAITNPAVKLILVSGAYGIGKTSTVSMSFKRNLPNWSVQWISLTSTTRFSMVLEYMANAIGHSLKADTLARNSKKVLKPILELFTKKLFAKDGRVIVVDQTENILLGLQGRDHTLLTLFLNAACSLQGGQGKVIFISDIRFSKEVFPENPAVSRIVMGRIPDNRYVKLILEYEMRKRNMISPGQTPDIPDKLYELVNGHPLTAKLSIDVIARHREKVKVIDTIDLGQVQAQIIKQLMEKINLDAVETQLMHVLSVFRTVINIPRLNRCLPQELCDLLGENIKRLFQMSFISAG